MVPSVYLRFCVLPGVPVFLIHGFLLPLGFSLCFFLSRLRCSVLRFLFYHLFFLWFFPPEFLAPAFPRYFLLSSHALLFLSPGVWNWSASFAFPHFSYTVHDFPSSLFPSCSSLLFHSLGAILTRSHLRFTPRRSPPFGPSQFLFGLFALFLVRLSSHTYRPLYVCILLLLFRSFYSLRSLIDTSHRLGGFPSILRLVVSLLLAFAVHTVSLFATSLAGLPFVPSCSLFCFSSFLWFLMGLLSFWWTFSSFLLGHGLAFMGNFSTYRVHSLSLWLFPVRFLRLLGFPSVHPPHAPLLGLSRICHCVLLFPLLRDSVESQFLRDGVLPTGRVSSVGGFVLLSHGFASCLLLLVSFLFGSVFPHSFSSLCRFPSASSGLPWGFSTSLRCWLAFPSALVLFLFLINAALSSWGFSQLLSSPVVIFSGSITVQLLLDYKFPLIYCAFFHFVRGETLVSSLASSLRSIALVLQCLFGHCAWRRHLSRMVRCVLGIPSLTRSHIGCYV